MEYRAITLASSVYSPAAREEAGKEHGYTIVLSRVFLAILGLGFEAGHVPTLWLVLQPYPKDLQWGLKGLAPMVADGPACLVIREGR